MTLVYHGSPNLFDRFVYDKIGENGTSEGIGFYFTTSKSIARGYAFNKNNTTGYLYSVEFTGKKFLNYNDKSINRMQLKRFISSLPRYLENWYTIEEALKVEYESNDNDVDMVCSILHASGCYEKTLNKLKRILGYDSIMIDTPLWGNDQKIYIALTQDSYQIKNIEQIEMENN